MTDTIKTMGRLRKKYGGTIENLEIPLNYISGQCGWEFISKIGNLPKSIKERFSMIDIPSVKELEEIQRG